MVSCIKLRVFASIFLLHIFFCTTKIKWASGSTVTNIVDGDNYSQAKNIGRDMNC